jgi:cell division protein FtsB
MITLAAPPASTVAGAGNSAVALQRTNKKLRARILFLENQILSLKMNKPTLFIKERAKLRQFLAQMQLYFAANSKSIKIESDKVLAALTFLKGLAFD